MLRYKVNNIARFAPGGGIRRCIGGEVGGMQHVTENASTAQHMGLQFSEGNGKSFRFGSAKRRPSAVRPLDAPDRPGAGWGSVLNGLHVL